MPPVNDELRHQMIAEAAYFLAERRGFSGGDPMADWLVAEAQVDLGIDPAHGSVAAFDRKLAAVTDRLRAMRGKLDALPIGARKKLEADVEALTKLRRRLQRRVAQMRGQGETADAAAKQQAQKIWTEISELFDRSAPAS